MEKDFPASDQYDHSRGCMKQVREKDQQITIFVMCAIFVQIVATIMFSLFQLINGSCTAIPSTILYSLERGSEGISMSLEDAALARKL